MATEAEIASAIGTINAFDLVPLWLQEISGLVRTVALVVGAAVIPLIIWRSGVRRDEHARSSASSIEKRRATFELIRTLTTDQALTDRASKFFRYRRFRSGAEGSVNPYIEEGADSFIHDCLVILNVNELACIEILNGMVDEDLLYQTSRDAILQTTIVVDHLNDALGEDRSDNVPHLMEVVERWTQRADKEKTAIASPLFSGDLDTGD